MTVDLFNLILTVIGAYLCFFAGRQYQWRQVSERGCEKCYKKGFKRGMEMVIEKMKNAGLSIEVVEVSTSSPDGDPIKVEVKEAE